jgi:pantoate--beta-alanine ligase
MRPGHFDGVIAIVSRLFRIVQPEHAYFGQKDFQQCAVIRELVRREDLAIELHICPTVREADGLAMSSRNTRLTPDERTAAAGINKALSRLCAEIGDNDPEPLLREAKAKLEETSPLLRCEYLAVVDAETLNTMRRREPGRSYVVVIAAWCGSVRLIDNMFLSS